MASRHLHKLKIKYIHLSMKSKKNKAYIQNITDISLLSNILNIDKDAVLFNSLELTKAQEEKLNSDRKLIREGYPLDYVLGQVKIKGCNFCINKSVLIPRPETETLIEIIILKSINRELLIDIGTGSGFIGILLSDYFDKVVMTDVSQDAIDVAKINVKSNNKKNTQIILSDLLKNNTLRDLIDRSNSYTLVANLPYVPIEDEKQSVANNIQFEPSIAIFSGEDGLTCYRDLIQEISTLSNPPTECYFELDPRNIQIAKNMIQKLGYISHILNDENNQERFLVCRKDYKQTVI